MRPGVTDTTRRHLVVDGGKSKTDAIVIDSAGRTLSSSRGPGLEMIGSPNGPAMVVASLRETLAGLEGLDAGLHTVSFGLNGVQAPSAGATTALESIRGLTNGQRYVVASDAIMNYAGALGFRPGVVVAAGTGADILAVGHDGGFHRVDASGPLLGDRGSGYEVGRRGLANAFRVADGLPGSSSLYEQMLERFGGVDPAMAAVYGDINPSKVIASFSRNVAASAEAGDADALRILSAAGEVLAQGVAAAARKAELDLGPFDVACTGGLFRVGRLIEEPFEAELAALASSARVRPAGGGPLDGGTMFALQPRPVWTAVSTWLGG
jgi:N-acetylglucosamine kinase-like BadF-type ATPase